MSKIILTRSDIFRDRLVSLRGSRKKSDFARFLGTTPQNYQRYESGRIPDADILLEIASRCNVKVDWLLGVEDRSVKPIEGGGQVERVVTRTGVNSRKIQEHNSRAPEAAPPAPVVDATEQSRLETLASHWRELRLCVQSDPEHFKWALTRIHEIADRYADHLRTQSKTEK